MYVLSDCSQVGESPYLHAIIYTDKYYVQKVFESLIKGASKREEESSVLEISHQREGLERTLARYADAASASLFHAILYPPIPVSHKGSNTC